MRAGRCAAQWRGIQVRLSELEVTCMRNRPVWFVRICPGSARVPRVGFGVAPKQSFERFLTRCRFRASRKVRVGEDALASTRDACATQKRDVELLAVRSPRVSPAFAQLRRSRQTRSYNSAIIWLRLCGGKIDPRRAFGKCRSKRADCAQTSSNRKSPMARTVFARYPAGAGISGRHHCAHVASASSR
jgi:hypothetical protein